MIWLFSCIDPPQVLPQTRLEAPIKAQMVQYGSLKSFLITKGEPKIAILWKTQTIDPISKECAIKQMPQHSTALLITNPLDIPKAKQYFHMYKILEKPLNCPEKP